MGRMEDHHGPIIYQPPDAHERAYLNRTAKTDSLARNRTGHPPPPPSILLPLPASLLYTHSLTHSLSGNIINGQGQSCHPGRVPARAPAAPRALRPRARAAPRRA